MGKVVKYCAACDESFAEKFGFCPNCGQAMTAFEMNPLTKEAVISEEVEPTATENSAVPRSEPVSFETAPLFEPSPIPATSGVLTNQTQIFFDDSIAEKVQTKDAPRETKTFAAAAGTNGNGSYHQNASNDYQAASGNQVVPDDDGFHITVIEEKNGKQRNALLLGSMALILTLAMGSTVYSLFNKDMGVGAIGDETLFALVPIVESPMELEEPPQEEKVGDEGAGGGGGGRKDPEPIGKGTIPPQLKERFVTPSNEDISVTNPAIRITRATKGPNDIIPKDRSAVNGDLNSTNPNRSSGLGADNLGMGQNGSGGFGNNGRDGMGSNGTGGVGNSLGNNYGNGPGTGGSQPKPPPPAPPKPVGVTTDVKIISKPGAKYTDAARQNQFSGTVRLRVTFLPSGQVGSVSAVGSLPYGLTEQAIAAAKSIRFEPAKRDGVPIPKVKQIDYSFTLY
jgi:TonB family protein